MQKGYQYLLPAFISCFSHLGENKSISTYHTDLFINEIAFQNAHNNTTSRAIASAGFTRIVKKNRETQHSDQEDPAIYLLNNTCPRKLTAGQIATCLCFISQFGRPSAAPHWFSYKGKDVGVSLNHASSKLLIYLTNGQPLMYSCIAVVGSTLSTVRIHYIVKEKTHNLVKMSKENVAIIYTGLTIAVVIICVVSATLALFSLRAKRKRHLRNRDIREMLLARTRVYSQARSQKSKTSDSTSVLEILKVIEKSDNRSEDEMLSNLEVQKDEQNPNNIHSVTEKFDGLETREPAVFQRDTSQIEVEAQSKVSIFSLGTVPLGADLQGVVQFHNEGTMVDGSIVTADSYLGPGRTEDFKKTGENQGDREQSLV